MIDLNTIISNALTAAVTTAVAPLNERVTALEGICATQHEAMVAMRDRIAALENNPAQGQDAWMEQRVAALEAHLTEAKFVEHLDNQEWFWEKLQNKIDASVEQSMDHHLECYDHDSYDEMASKVADLPDLDDYVTRDSVREEIEDVINNATISIRA